MNKIFFLLLAMLLSLSLSAQTTPDIKFLGIPINGAKADMIQKLKAKGFALEKWDDGEVLIGDFNGRKSHIYVHTNRNIVDRILVAYADYTDEAQIKIDYNNLLEQFKNNTKKYIEFHENKPIPEDEDISYELLVHNKRYDAAFYPLPEISNEIESAVQQRVAGMSEEEANTWIQNWNIDQFSRGCVWFTIHEFYGKYGISIYYDNKRNMANGEDL